MLPLVPDAADMAAVRSVNAAAAVFPASMVMLQVPVPVQAPDQPVKIELGSAAAVSVTVVPAIYVAEQTDPQVIPAEDEVIEPVPVPVLVVVRTYCGGNGTDLLTSLEKLLSLSDVLYAVTLK